MAIALFVSILGFFISMVVAGGKNRSPAWGFLGFLLPLIGVIVVLCLESRPEVTDPAAS